MINSVCTMFEMGKPEQAFQTYANAMYALAKQFDPEFTDKNIKPILGGA